MKKILLFVICLWSLTLLHAEETWHLSERFHGNLPASSIAIDSYGDIFVGGLDGWLYRSTDEGITWSRLSNGPLTRDPIESIAITSNNQILAKDTNGSIFRSMDRGHTWTKVRVELPHRDAKISSFALDSEDRLLVGSRIGILNLAADGIGWRDQGRQSLQIDSEVSAILVSSDNQLFVGGSSDGRVFTSTDGGQNWFTSVLTSAPIRSLTIDAAGRIFASTAGDGIFRSLDRGRKWKSVNSGLHRRNVQSLISHPRGHLVAGTLGGGIFRSTNNGSTWDEVAAIPAAFGVWSLAVGPEGEIYAATDAGVYHSRDDGVTWSLANLITSPVRSLIANFSGDMFAGTFGGGVYRSTDNGDTWLQTNSGLAHLNVASLGIDADGQLFAGTVFGGLYRSSNNGDSWTQADFDSNTVTAVAVNNSGFIFVGLTNFLGIGDEGAFFSENDGGNWVAAPLVPFITGDVNSFAIDQNGNVWIGGSFGAFRNTHADLSDPDNVWAPYWWREFTDSTLTRLFSPAQEFAPADVRALALDNDDLFAGSWGGGVRHFSDTTWTEVNTGVTDSVILALAAPNSQRIFAGSLGGSIFLSTDRGQSWTLSNPGLTNNAITALTPSPNGFIFFGTNGDGVFRNDLPGVNVSWCDTGLGNLAGTQDTVYICVDDVSGLDIISYQLEVTFDDSVLNALGATAVGTITEGFGPPTVNTSVPGKITVGGFGTTSLQGAGSLICLIFDVVGSPGDRTDLCIEAVIFNSGTPGSNVLNPCCPFDVINEFDISGTVTYCPTAGPVQNTTMTLPGGASSQLTDASGQFLFEDVTGGLNYTLTSTKEGDIAAFAISCFDAALAARMAVGLDAADHCDSLAADVDRDGNIFTFDAALICRFAVGLPPFGLSDRTGTWRFEPVDRSYTPFVADQTGQDFVAALLGDVDGNWTPASGGGSVVASSHPARIRFSEDVTWSPDGFEMATTLHFTGGLSAMSFEVELGYDADVIRFKEASTTSEGWEVSVNSSEDGRLRLGMFSTTPLLEASEFARISWQVLRNGVETNVSLEKALVNAEAQAGTVFSTELNGPIPSDFALHQNYPNPFNPETTIRYQLPKEAEVRLTIYNLRGQEIRSLVDEKKKAGFHTVIWNGKDGRGRQVASGVYLYRIRAGEFTEVKKLTLLR